MNKIIKFVKKNKLYFGAVIAPVVILTMAIYVGKSYFFVMKFILPCTLYTSGREDCTSAGVATFALLIITVIAIIAVFVYKNDFSTV